MRNRRATGIEVELAESFGARARGLVGRAPLPHDRALCLRPCNAVHGFGMRRAIDVVFCDAAGFVLTAPRTLRPRRVLWRLRARCVFEMRASVARRLGIRAGDRLEVL